MRDAPGVTPVSSPEGCPYPGHYRDDRCAECREKGGIIGVINLREWTRYRFDTRQCISWHERERTAEPGRLLAGCGVREAERGLTFDRLEIDRHNRQVFGELQAWRPGRRGLYVTGLPTEDNPRGNGVGKTAGLIALTLKLCGESVPCLFYQSRDLLDDLRAANRSGVGEGAILARVCSVAVLVLDDLGKESMRADSDWAREKLHQVIEARGRNGLALHVSSELLLPDGVRERYGSEYGPAIADRLEGACDVRILLGPSRRPARTCPTKASG